MKFFSYWMSGMLGISLIFLVFSCHQDEVLTKQKGTVSFNITSGTVNENARLSDDMPIVQPGMCDMELAEYAIVVVNQEPYKLDIKKWGEDFKTNLLELNPGIYVLSQFVVFDSDDNPLFATPTTESLFDKFVNIPLPVEFEVRSYEKIQNEIEVLCVEQFEPPDFGFKFWDINLKQVKNLCIFANYCEPDYGHLVAELHAMVFPSALEATPNDLIWEDYAQGAGELLCLSLPFDPDIDPAEQTYYIVLYINGIKYVATIDLAFVDMINESEKGYLHLNENCQGNIEPFYRVGMMGWEDLVNTGNDMDYNDLVMGFKITGDGDKLMLDLKPIARGAGYEHKFELVFKKGEVLGATGVVDIYDEADKTIVVLYESTHDLFGANYVNTKCDGPVNDFAVSKFTIDVSDDFVYYFHKPLKPCLHTDPTGEPDAYNLFLCEWSDDGMSFFTCGKCNYPNGIITPHDWTEGEMWKWPIESESILSAYPNFKDLDNWNPNWYLTVGTGIYPEDCD